MRLSFNTWPYCSYPTWLPAYPIDYVIKNLAKIGYENIEIGCASPVAFPPYIKNDTGKASKDESSNIARREVFINLEDTIASASAILKNKGRFSMVHLANRTDEIFNIMHKYNLTVKRARLVQSNIDSKPNLILVEGIKKSAQEIEWLPTLNVYTNGKYSKEIEDIYGLNE